MKVLVLCGGESAERIVSLASGDAVGMWLAEAGYEVLKFDPEHPDAVYTAEQKMAPQEIGLEAPPTVKHDGYNAARARSLLGVLDKFGPDVVFPILHGGFGEDGTVQALLEWVGVPYTGSRLLASALAMNKPAARVMFRDAGIPVTEGFMVPRERMNEVRFVQEAIAARVGYPAVVKPACGGSTIGLTKVFGPGDVAGALEAVRALGDQALIEAHFAGRELAATVVDGEAYPLVEIKPKAGFYDYSNKYTAGRTEYVCPAEISGEATRMLQEAAVRAFRALGCAGFARVDFLLGDEDSFVCLEVNTLPGMTAHSLVPKAARAKGELPSQLVHRIVSCALRDFGKTL